MRRYKLEGVSAAQVCVSRSAWVSAIKAVYDCFRGGKVPNRFEVLKQTSGSVRHISEMMRLSQKHNTPIAANIINNNKSQLELRPHFATRGQSTCPS